MEIGKTYEKLRYEQYFIDTTGDINHTGKARFKIEYKSINYVYNGVLTHANYCVYYDEERNVIQVHFEGTKDVPDWITNILFQPKYSIFPLQNQLFLNNKGLKHIKYLVKQILLLPNH